MWSPCTHVKKKPKQAKSEAFARFWRWWLRQGGGTLGTVGVWVGEEGADSEQNTPRLHREGLWEGRDSSGQAGALQCSSGDRTDRFPQPEEKAEPAMLSQSPTPSVSIT